MRGQIAGAREPGRSRRLRAECNRDYAMYTVAFTPLGRGSSMMTRHLDYPASIGWTGRAGARLSGILVTDRPRLSERQLRRETIKLHGDNLVDRTSRGAR